MSDLKTVLINDSRIEDISGEIGFKIEGGAQQSTYQAQQANTSSNSSSSWNFNVPSENIVTDRRLLIDTDITFVIGITNVPVGQYALQWGAGVSFGPYPLNALYQTQNATINNCNLSVNTQDVMASLLRMNDQKIHTYYDGWTPSMVDDVYYNYSDAVNTSNNPLSAIGNASYDNKFRGRGAHPITLGTIVHTLSTGGTNGLLLSTNVADTWVIEITTHLTEPILFLSPFISNPCVSNEAGFLGINNLSFNFVVDQSLKRVFRTTALGAFNPTYTFSLKANAFSDLRMLVNYLSVQPSQYAKISARNVLPLLQYDRYITNGSTTTAALAAGASGSYTSSNIALNQIPDTILIFARKPIASQLPSDSDSFFIINNISINFNNVSGILSSAQPSELWVLSQKAGSSQSYSEFIGKVNIASSATTDPGVKQISTTGSILALQPSYVFNLPEYLTSSSLGSFSLQYTIGLTNQSSAAITPEIVVITITSGYITTHQGTTSSYSGVINREMCMSGKEGASVPRLAQSDYERLVGGVRDNRGVANMMKHFKSRRSSNSPGTMTAGVMSGGVMSGGKIGKYIK